MYIEEEIDGSFLARMEIPLFDPRQLDVKMLFLGMTLPGPEISYLTQII
jgi:hypothetical protein